MATIAAQACQTCRNRKSKCDEQRPTCGLCWRLNVECQYREPLPTKKDKTMVHILRTLKTLETKFDNLAMGQSSASRPNLIARTSKTDPSSQLPRKTGQSATIPSHHSLSKLQQSYQRLTVPHKVLLWPSIYSCLTAKSRPQAVSDLQYIHQGGTNWFIKLELEKHSITLPVEPHLPSIRLDSPISDRGYSTRYLFPTITIQQVQEYTDAYFDTFNLICPILRYDSFRDEISSRLLREGYADGDPECVLALMVYALGQVAIEGVFGEPISTQHGVPSGFRGGTQASPPGIETFNEARRRFGLVESTCAIENVQVLLLQATYYEANSRHLDSWRSTVAASMACQVLIQCRNVNWSSHTGDMIKRAFWACILSEDLYHVDLDLPQTDLHTLEHEVPLPLLDESQEPTDWHSGSERCSHYQYHFLATIALRRIIARIRAAVNEPSSAQGEPYDSCGGPSIPAMCEMDRQLDSWRSLLPIHLYWLDNDMFDFPNGDPTRQRLTGPLFSPDQGPVPVGHNHNLDVATALLRTRFYYARFMMFRPFIYKALHFPELMTSDDASCCAFAIRAACLWPLSMAPPKNKKRLVPHLFTWTQSFVELLLVLRMARGNSVLRQICDERLSEDDLQKTTTLLLDWIRDVKQVDGIAEWSWTILEPIFADGEKLP